MSETSGASSSDEFETFLGLIDNPETLGETPIERIRSAVSSFEDRARANGRPTGLIEFNHVDPEEQDLKKSLLEIKHGAVEYIKLARSFVDLQTGQKAAEIFKCDFLAAEEDMVKHIPKNKDSTRLAGNEAAIILASILEELQEDYKKGKLWPRSCKREDGTDY